MSIELILGDCLEVMKGMADKSIDAVITDPPYELGFMGKSWDNTGIAYQVGMWAEVLRILKPGGHLLSFGGSRTYHRMACAIEDAGFEIRDQLQWIYSQGFPKSLDVSKAIDKLDAVDVRVKRNLYFTAWMRSTGITAKQINDATDSFMGSHYLTEKEQPAVATLDMFDKIKHLLPNPPADIMELMKQRTVESENFKKREVVGQSNNQCGVGWVENNQAGYKPEFDITSPATPEAQYWQGWGTALKPAHEPIVLARKPITGTVAQNVLAYGTGGINIDGCRVGTNGEDRAARYNGKPPLGGGGTIKFGKREEVWDAPSGRFPANILHDGSDEVVGMFPASKARTGKIGSGGNGTSIFGTDGKITVRYDDTETNAARFFYSAKASRSERNAGLEMVSNHHPTVKPIAVMRWLVRLITPPNGTVLDPFTGSGTTGIAAVLEGFDFIGIEREAEYHEIARRRIEHWQSQFQMRLPLEAE